MTAQLNPSEVSLTRNGLDFLARHSLKAFLHTTFQLLHSGEQLLDNWHLHSMAWHLEQVAAGHIPRLIITMPPRHLKSILTSVALPAWLMGRDPTIRLLTASYSGELAARHTRDFRQVIGSARYQRIFPRMRVRPGQDRQNEQVTTLGGFRHATSFGGTLTGLGGRLIIIDDPIKADDIMSDAERKRVNEQFDRAFSTRLDNPGTDAIIIVMQRLHDDDLVGHLTNTPGHGWTVLNIPAIAPEDMDYRIGNRADQIYHRQVEEVIDDRRMSREALDRLRQQMGSRAFDAQYNQNPAGHAGNVIRRAWLHHYETAPDRRDLLAVVQSWDTAFEQGEDNDWSVCTTWGLDREHLYLLDVVRERLEFPSLLRRAVQLAEHHRANQVLIEKAASGRSLAQSLRSQLCVKVISLSPHGDKEARIAGVSHMFEAGTVLLPREASWLETFERELLGFPTSAHDDQVDSVSQFLGHVRRLRPGALQFDRDGAQVHERRRIGTRASHATTLGRRSDASVTYGTLGGFREVIYDATNDDEAA
ncbi:MAG: phage terminase large subunit [Hyphomicrobiaceae bacterium]|nr:phage terminase large subunit [Hyphomicrobiaceae bacterium]